MSQRLRKSCVSALTTKMLRETCLEQTQQVTETFYHCLCVNCHEYFSDRERHSKFHVESYNYTVCTMSSSGSCKLCDHEDKRVKKKCKLSTLIHLYTYTLIHLYTYTLIQLIHFRLIDYTLIKLIVRPKATCYVCGDSYFKDNVHKL